MIIEVALGIEEAVGRREDDEGADRSRPLDVVLPFVPVIAMTGMPSC